MMYPHKCLKCQADYSDNDPEPYFCANCIEERKKVAIEVDKKISTVSKVIKSDLQTYNDISKSKGAKFVHMKDLGISWQ